jgi:hypothetical protein
MSTNRLAVPQRTSRQPNQAGSLIMIFTDILQWTGCVTGISGSFLLAINTRYSGVGFLLFLISNGFWTLYGIATNAPGLIAMQIAFTITSMIGIYRWLLKPMIATPSYPKSIKPWSRQRC